MNDKNMHITIPYITVPHQKKTKVALLELSRSYRVSFRFWIMDCGHEKFHKERSVEYFRRKLLARMDSFNAIPTAQDYLGNVWIKLNDNSLMVSRWTLSELMTEELRLQLLVPGDMGSFAFKQARGNQSANSVQGKNHYPVPDHLVAQTVGVTVISNQLKVLCDSELQGTHLRSYRARQGVITLDHYWHTRIRKSGALQCSSTIEAAGDNLTFEQYGHRLLQQEHKARAENRKKSRIRQASFPQPQGIRYLSREHLPLEAQEPLPLGVHLEFIHSGRYLILTGNMETGRTHPAIGQGIKVCSGGFLVWFIMILRMLAQIRESRSEKSISNREQCFEKNGPTICDKFGDIACGKEGPKLPYNHRSLMATGKSMIMTTTRSFDCWHESFRYPVLPVAIIDNLICLVFIINRNGQWLCIKETCK
jgi:DNA replication protein DnaC